MAGLANLPNFPKHRYYNYLCSTTEPIQDHNVIRLICSRFEHILIGHVDKYDQTLHQSYECFLSRVKTSWANLAN